MTSSNTWQLELTSNGLSNAAGRVYGIASDISAGICL